MRFIWSIVCVFPLAYTTVLMVDALKLEMLGCEQHFKYVPRCEVNGVDVGVGGFGIEGTSPLIIHAVAWYIAGILILGLLTLVAKGAHAMERNL